MRRTTPNHLILTVIWKVVESQVVAKSVAVLAKIGIALKIVFKTLDPPSNAKVELRKLTLRNLYWLRWSTRRVSAKTTIPLLRTALSTKWSLIKTIRPESQRSYQTLLLRTRSYRKSTMAITSHLTTPAKAFRHEIESSLDFIAQLPSKTRLWLSRKNRCLKISWCWRRSLNTSDSSEIVWSAVWWLNWKSTRRQPWARRLLTG